MVCSISLPKQDKFGDVYHGHIWDIPEFDARICDVHGQVGDIIISIYYRAKKYFP